MASYSKSDKQKAMTVLASLAGNAVLASQELKAAHGIGAEPSTLRRWRTSEMSAFYDGLLEEAPDMTATVINETLETARLAAQAERLAVERALHSLQTGDCKDPARTALDLSRIKAMNVEKYLTLMGRPTQIVELTNPDEAMVELAKLGVLKPVDAGAAIDGEAFELPPEVEALLEGSTADHS